MTLEGVYGNWFAYRFKPVVRVKAPSVHTLDLMIKRASVWFDALSPEEQIAHREAQRASWARCEAELGVWERRYLDAHRAYLAGARYYSPVKRSEYQVAKGIWNA